MVCKSGVGLRSSAISQTQENLVIRVFGLKRVRMKSTEKGPAFSFSPPFARPIDHMAGQMRDGGFTYRVGGVPRDQY